jgi:dihydroxyacetone kinase
MVDYSSLHLRLSVDTSNNLHFGLACQQARADGLGNVNILPVCDDVSMARSEGVLAGRRALAGTILGITFHGFVAWF